MKCVKFYLSFFFCLALSFKIYAGGLNNSTEEDPNIGKELTDKKGKKYTVDRELSVTQNNGADIYIVKDKSNNEFILKVAKRPKGQSPKANLKEESEIYNKFKGTRAIPEIQAFIKGKEDENGDTFDKEDKIIMEKIDGITVKEFINKINNEEDDQNKKNLIETLSDIVVEVEKKNKILIEGGFTHNDLHLDNVLVKVKENGVLEDVKIIDLEDHKEDRFKDRNIGFFKRKVEGRISDANYRYYRSILKGKEKNFYFKDEDKRYVYADKFQDEYDNLEIEMNELGLELRKSINYKMPKKSQSEQNIVNHKINLVDTEIRYYHETIQLYDKAKKSLIRYIFEKQDEDVKKQYDVRILSIEDSRLKEFMNEISKESEEIKEAGKKIEEFSQKLDDYRKLKTDLESQKKSLQTLKLSLDKKEKKVKELKEKFKTEFINELQEAEKEVKNLKDEIFQKEQEKKLKFNREYTLYSLKRIKRHQNNKAYSKIVRPKVYDKRTVGGNNTTEYVVKKMSKVNQLKSYRREDIRSKKSALPATFMLYELKKLVPLLGDKQDPLEEALQESRSNSTDDDLELRLRKLQGENIPEEAEGILLDIHKRQTNKASSELSHSELMERLRSLNQDEYDDSKSSSTNINDELIYDNLNGIDNPVVKPVTKERLEALAGHDEGGFYGDNVAVVKEDVNNKKCWGCTGKSKVTKPKKISDEIELRIDGFYLYGKENLEGIHLQKVKAVKDLIKAANIPERFKRNFEIDIREDKDMGKDRITYSFYNKPELKGDKHIIFNINLERKNESDWKLVLKDVFNNGAKDPKPRLTEIVKLFAKIHSQVFLEDEEFSIQNIKEISAENIINEPTVQELQDIESHHHDKSLMENYSEKNLIEFLTIYQKKKAYLNPYTGYLEILLEENH